MPDHHPSWPTSGHIAPRQDKSTVIDGCPTFAKAYVGRKRWAKPNNSFRSIDWQIHTSRPKSIHSPDATAEIQHTRSPEGTSESSPQRSPWLVVTNLYSFSRAFPTEVSSRPKRSGGTCCPVDPNNQRRLKAPPSPLSSRPNPDFLPRCTGNPHACALP
jgi:hypothetical protein